MKHFGQGRGQGLGRTSEGRRIGAPRARGTGRCEVVRGGLCGARLRILLIV